MTQFLENMKQKSHQLIQYYTKIIREKSSENVIKVLEPELKTED